jgi:hypothetical protein
LLTCIGFCFYNFDLEFSKGAKISTALTVYVITNSFEGRQTLGEAMQILFRDQLS